MAVDDVGGLGRVQITQCFVAHCMVFGFYSKYHRSHSLKEFQQECNVIKFDAAVWYPQIQQTVDPVVL